MRLIGRLFFTSTSIRAAISSKNGSMSERGARHTFFEVKIARIFSGIDRCVSGGGSGGAMNEGSLPVNVGSSRHGGRDTTFCSLGESLTYTKLSMKFFTQGMVIICG